MHIYTNLRFSFFPFQSCSSFCPPIVTEKVYQFIGHLSKINPLLQFWWSSGEIHSWQSKELFVVSGTHTQTYAHTQQDMGGETWVMCSWGRQMENGMGSLSVWFVLLPCHIFFRILYPLDTEGRFFLSMGSTGLTVGPEYARILVWGVGGTNPLCILRDNCTLQPGCSFWSTSKHKRCHSPVRLFSMVPHCLLNKFWVSLIKTLKTLNTWILPT